MKNSFLFILIFLFGALRAISQTTVNIVAASDNTMYENPVGSSNALGQNIFSGTTGTGSPRRGLIRFNLAGVIPPNASITSVRLTLNCNLSRAIPDNVSLHKLLTDWGEGTSNAGSTSDGSGVPATPNDATWAARFFPATAWATAGGDYNPTESAAVSINSTGFYQWTSPALAADVQSWVTMPATNFGWILRCNETTASSARKFGSRENATLANRPSLSVTYTTTLPVTLSYFKAVPKSNGVLLSWETSQEINNQYFKILHSIDGVSFSPVGRVNGLGTSSTKHQYNFIHKLILAGNHFYKLAQVDFDGKEKFSSVDRVFFLVDAANVKLFPNPVSNEFQIVAGINLQNCTYRVINSGGVVLLSGRVGLGSIKAEALFPGMYYLCIYGNNELMKEVMFYKM